MWIPLSMAGKVSIQLNIISLNTYTEFYGQKLPEPSQILNTIPLGKSMMYL